SERMKKKRLDFSSEALRPYFQDQKVIDGLLQVAGKLFDIQFEKDEQRPVWHDQAIYYRVLDAKNNEIAGFYLDIYARAHKQGGAWMDVCRSRHLNSAGDEVIPIAFLNCNFTPPVNGEPSLLTHDEVETLFHEFGHGLHHMLTKINIPSVSGISGVEWDAVELPSQFLENWCWERESLDLFARHVETGETIPEDLFEAMNAAKNFGAGMMLVRQLEFGLFDLRLHRDYPDSKPENWVKTILDQVRNEISVVKPPDYTRFPNAFGHIFGGGYSSGYYSYLWAEQLSADAFSRFEEDGLFNQNTGSQFKKEILEVGGSRAAMESFKAFRGREPEIDALLRHRGVA
ncbi:MAG: M3 family metallopeptidase, partial [bacterium]